MTFLVLLAMALAAADLWFTAARSTIPLRLDGIVSKKEVRHEKHPPRDDVCLLELGRSFMHVDQSVFDVVNVGTAVKKDLGSKQLLCDGRAVELGWSADFRGMMWAMPLALGIILAAALWGARVSTER